MKYLKTFTLLFFLFISSTTFAFERIDKWDWFVSYQWTLLENKVISPNTDSFYTIKNQVFLMPGELHKDIFKSLSWKEVIINVHWIWDSFKILDITWINKIKEITKIKTIIEIPWKKKIIVNLTEEKLIKVLELIKKYKSIKVTFEK